MNTNERISKNIIIYFFFFRKVGILTVVLPLPFLIKVYRYQHGTSDVGLKLCWSKLLATSK